jgi:hypothetical protein
MTEFLLTPSPRPCSRGYHREKKEEILVKRKDFNMQDKIQPNVGEKKMNRGGIVEHIVSTYPYKTLRVDNILKQMYKMESKVILK